MGHYYNTVLVERRGPIGWLIFNRPKAWNAALTDRWTRRLSGLGKRLEEDDEYWSSSTQEEVRDSKLVSTSKR